MSEQTPEYDNSRQVVDDLKYLIATGCSDKTLKARIYNFAKEHALSVAHEAVEEVNEINKSVGLGKNILEFTRGTATYVLTRIKSKL